MGTTIVDIIKNRSVHQPDKTAFVFLINGEEECVKLRYGEHDLRASAIAAQLQKKTFREKGRICYTLPAWNIFQH
jgi:acyl-CoA synthetase (AMP-forming)/AMP-acid ligase II